MHDSVLYPYKQGLAGRQKKLAGIVMNIFKSLIGGERSHVNTPVYRFFQVAIWTPAVFLVSLPLLESMFRGPQGLEDILLTYGLSFGIIAYLAFAMWATWYIKSKSERSVVRLIWWAPIIFIPFYGVPWIAYGLFHAATGETSVIAMALLWVGFSPYIIAAGYVFAAVSFVIYEVFFRSTSANHDFVRVAPGSTSSMAGSTELFGNNVEREGFVSSEDIFAFYPRKTFLGQQGLFAYHAILMITDGELDNFFELAGKLFDQALIKQGNTKIYSNSNGGALQFSIRQEFNGLIIELTTNSKTLLEQLDALFKAPPPPWFAFTKMEPIEAVMDKQGSLEYWWEWIWSPFWGYAPIEIRTAYLKDHKASDEWAECLAGQVTATD